MPAVYAAAAGATKFQFYWLCALILAFCYELPLMRLTSMDRLNPRLFDGVAVLGAFIVLFQNGNLGNAFRNPVFRRWFWLMAWFTFCATIWAGLWLPWGPAGKYSLYYAGKYLEGLLCIFLVAAIPLNSRQKHTLHWMVVMGGIAVATYALYERATGSNVRTIAEGKEIKRAEGTLFSCLGPTYFHVASFSSLSCAMTFALANKYRPCGTKTFLYGAALFSAWPAVFCGSRAGLAILLVVLAGVFFFMKRTRLTLTISACLAVCAASALFTSGEFVERASEASTSVRRLLGAEESRGGANSIMARIGMGLDGLLGGGNDAYGWQGMRLPVFGGGFYAVPHSQGGRISKFRVGYGVHNAYLFPYEQAGILGWILAGLFLFATIKSLIHTMRQPNETDKQFAIGMWCAVLAFIPAAWFGQIFWRGFGTENFNTYMIVLLVLATRATNPMTRANPFYRYRPTVQPGRPG